MISKLLLFDLPNLFDKSLFFGLEINSLLFDSEITDADIDVGAFVGASVGASVGADADANVDADVDVDVDVDVESQKKGT